MSLRRQREASEAVAGQRVGSALQHNHRRAVIVHHGLHDGLEDLKVALIVDAFLERNVHRVVAAGLGADLVHGAGAGEKLVAVLVEADGHHPVGEVESFLHAVAMVHVDVDVKHARMMFQQFQNADDDVVDVAEARRLVLLRMVQSAAPVDANVALVLVDLLRALQARARVIGAELEETVEDRAVVAQVEVFVVLQ